MKETAEFVNDQPFFNASGLKGVKIRRASTTVPETSFPIEFMEFTGERKVVLPEIHDPGATMLGERLPRLRSVASWRTARTKPVAAWASS